MSAPQLPSDSIRIEDFDVSELIPVSSEFYQHCYGRLPSPIDSVYVVGKHYVRDRTGLLLYHKDISSDRRTDYIHYLEIDSAGHASSAVRAAAYDNMVAHHRIASVYHSRYGLVQVREASSPWTVDKVGVQDTLFSHITHFDFPIAAPADTSRYYKLWRLR